MIIVAGSSWACGEWLRTKSVDREDYRVVHGGLSRYLTEQGYEQINLGVEDSSNLLIAERIRNWIQSHPDQKISKIFVFQTDYVRDSGALLQTDYDNVRTIHDFSNTLLSKFYLELSDISHACKVPVYLIGADCDTLSPEMIQESYPGVSVACQSMVRLLVEDNPNTPNPVLSWYTSQSIPLIMAMKEKFSIEQMNMIMNIIEEGKNRESMVRSYRRWFYPDGVHPNRYGHKKLFDFLLDSKLI